MGKKVKSSVLSVLLLIGFLVCDQAGSTEREVYRISLPAQGLAESLIGLSEQTDKLLLFSHEVASQLTANPVKGSYTLDQALELMLKGTGYSGGLSKKGVLMISLMKSEDKNNTGKIKGSADMKPDKSFLATAMAFLFSTNAALGQDSSAPEGNENTENLVSDDYSWKLEEIIVTATKREASLQNVPISVNVISGAFIDEVNLNKMEDLAPYVPNLAITEGAESTFIEIRGLGSGGNFGFEQSVGMFIDGIYNGRDRQFRSPFLDLERVEVLRGPQGTLFGKNTISGAINIVTAKPGDQLEANASVEYEPEYEGYTAIGIVSGSLSNELGARLALKKADIGSFLHNGLMNDEDHAREELVARGTVAWKPGDKLEVTGKVEFSEFQKFGENLQIIRVGPGLLPAYQAADPDFEFINDDRTSKGPESTDTDTENVTLAIDYELDSGLILNSVTGYSAFDSADDRDVDWSPLELARELITQDFEQLSQEIRLSSPVGGSFDYILGLYGQTSSFDYRRLSALSFAPFGFPPPFDTRVSSLNRLKQDADSYSVFAQGTWHINDAWHLTAGFRYNHEKKTGTQSECYTQVGSFPCLDPVTDPVTFALSEAIWNVVGFFPHSNALKRTEEDVSPSLNIRWEASDDVMLYASVNRGFKGGGFNAADRVGDNPEFENEKALAFEVGGKTMLFNGTARLNFALFRTEYEDLQVSSFVNTGFIVGNAAEAIVQGIEVDGLWQATPELVISGAFGLLDAEYDDYSGASCSYAQEYLGEPGCVGGVRDISGRDITGVNFSGSMKLEYTRPIGAGLSMKASLDANYSESPFVERDPDEYGSYTIINARLALVSAGAGWSLALIGKNLGDKRFLSNIFDAPVQGGSRLGARNAPRTVSIRASYHY